MPDEYMASKRPRIVGPIAELHEALVECYRDQRGPEFLWDTGSRLQLVWPSVEISQKRNVFYIGREKAEKLYAYVLRLARPDVMQLLGAKGSGKSTVMAAIAGYLHVSGTKRVVYVNGFHFARTPFPVLHEALLLAWWGQESEVQELREIHDMKELQRWCYGGNVLFVVDDWDKVELKETAMEDLEFACRSNILIRISSGKSREQHAHSKSDKAGDYILTYEFDGPFTPAELKTWLVHSGLPDERLTLLDYYTGGFLRLARFYSETADAESYRRKIAATVTSRVESEIVANLTTKEHVRAALEMVTSHDGLHILRPLGEMKLACFYKEGFGYRILCPYLRTVAENSIVFQGTLLESKLQLADFQTWIAAVQADIGAGMSTARIGWNIEGLFISVLRVQGQLMEGYPFAMYVTYGDGKEIDALRSLTNEALLGGVLLGPEAFSESAVDVVYLILLNGRIELVAVQVTVAQWKAWEKKNSYTTWEKDVIPKWIEEGLSHAVVQDFWYVMPKSVRLEGVRDVQVKAFSEFCPRLRFLNVVDLADPAEKLSG